MRVLTLSPDQILPPLVGMRDSYDEDELRELAADIRARGLLSPLVVTPADDKWRLVAGSRRLAACRLIELQEIPCVERAGDEEAQVSDMLAENLHRKPTNPLEEARVFAIMQEATGKTAAEIAEVVGKGPQYVANRLRVWHGPEDVRQALADEVITLSAALEFERCTHDGDRRFLLSHAIQSGASAALVRQWVQRAAADRAQLPAGTPTGTGVLEAIVAQPVMLVCEWHREPIEANTALSFTVCPYCFKFLQDLRDQVRAKEAAEGEPDADRNP